MTTATIRPVNPLAPKAIPQAAPAAAAPAAAAPSEPTTNPVAKTPKVKIEKVAHPLIGNPDPAIYPFENCPEDFSVTKHLPLAKKDFKSEVHFYQWRVNTVSRTLDRLKGDLEMAKLGGSKQDRAGIKRIGKMAESIQRLQEKLSSQGVDTVSVLKNSGVDIAALKALLANMA